MREVNKLKGKICHCHKHPGVTEGMALDEGSNLTDEEEERGRLEYKTDQSHHTPLIALEEILDQEIYQVTSPEPVSEVHKYCQTWVVTFVDKLVKIADDERSEGFLSSELSSSEDDDDVPELESLTNQENQVILPVPSPMVTLPPYIVSGQHAIHSKVLLSLSSIPTHLVIIC